MFSYYAAIAQLAAGDRKNYRQTCSEMLHRFGNEPTSEISLRILYMALPGNGLDPADLVRLARITSFPRLLGPALCRAGDYHESLKIYSPRSDQFLGRAWDWLFVAIAQHGVSQVDEARESIAKAREWISQQDADSQARYRSDAAGGWSEYVEVGSLLPEVESLLDENPKNSQQSPPARDPPKSVP